MPVGIKSCRHRRASRIAWRQGLRTVSASEEWEGYAETGDSGSLPRSSGQGVARTFGREPLYDLNLADGRTLRYVRESDLEIISPVLPPDPASDQAIEAGLIVPPDPDP